MKCDVLLDMLFDLLNKRKLTASYFAEKYGLSVRSVYRYVDVLSGVAPVTVHSGRGGGICISDTYKLPVGFLTHEEYRAADEALEAMYSQLPEERFLTARKKLGAQDKTEQNQLFFSGDANCILIDNGTWGDSRSFSEKVRLFENSARNRKVLEIVYFSREGERSVRKIDPHILVYKQNVWYVYAYCHQKKAFRLFRVGRVYSAFFTGENFVRRDVKREDIPLQFWETATSEQILLEVHESAFADVQDWLGCENMSLAENETEQTAPDSLPCTPATGFTPEKPAAPSEESGTESGEKSDFSADFSADSPSDSSSRVQRVRYAKAVLPVDDVLAKKILSLGAGVKVLEPQSLRLRVSSLASEISATYRE